jgi:ribosome-associated translation inhibitor RaiA
MKRLIIAVALALPFAVYAAPPGSSAFKDCSMKMSKTDKVSKKQDLLAKAKVKEDEAKKVALSAGPAGATIAKGGIEMEDGCLVYSYHVRAADKKTQTEVFVDAGNGNILKTEHEGKLRTAVEKPIDKTKEVAAKAKEKVTGEPSTSQAKKP